MNFGENNKYKIGDRVIIKTTGTKGFITKVWEKFYILNGKWMPENILELDKQYYREERFKSLLNPSIWIKIKRLINI